MLSRSRALSLLVVGLLLVASCKSFSFKAEADDMLKVQSAFVLVGSSGDLQGECGQLVHPDRQEKYAFFVQFKPNETGEEWEQVSNSQGWQLSPKIKGKSISIKIEKSLLERSTELQIALVVRMADGEWHCDRAALVPKGDASFAIGPTGLDRLF